MYKSEDFSVTCMDKMQVWFPLKLVWLCVGPLNIEGHIASTLPKISLMCSWSIVELLECVALSTWQYFYGLIYVVECMTRVVYYLHFITLTDITATPCACCCVAGFFILWFDNYVRSMGSYIFKTYFTIQSDHGNQKFLKVCPIVWLTLIT